MLIRIKQIRMLADGDGFGTDIPLGKGADAVVLQFRPRNPERPDREHVCDVKDSDHVAQLLAIKEGFEVHPEALKTAEGKAAAAAAARVKPAGQDGAGVDALSDDELEAELKRRRAAKDGSNVEPDDVNDKTVIPPEIDKLSRADLIAAVTKKQGKAPNPATSTKRLKEMLLEQ